LHWVLKSGNLKKSIQFYVETLGMSLLRHEEFAAACEASCNGKYNNPWSKSMIGYGSETENFALEVVYNYGTKKYKQGNDV